MRIAVLTVTADGKRLGERLVAALPGSTLYPAGSGDAGAPHQGERERLSDMVGRLFGEYDALVFIMALGIAVRAMAPLVRSKTSDPAVCVMDDLGLHVISVLGGHWRRANALCKQISGLMGSHPVITTGSDIRGMLAFDTIARANGAALERTSDLKHVAMAMIEARHVYFLSQVPHTLSLPANVIQVSSLGEIPKAASAAVIVTNRLSAGATGCPHVIIRPRNLALGVGCRRGTSKAAICDLIDETLSLHGLSSSSLYALGTITAKASEPGINQAAEAYGIPLRLFSPSEISSVLHLFDTSDFVKKAVGVGAVAEPCAHLCFESRRAITCRIARNGITLCVVEDTGYILREAS